MRNPNGYGSVYKLSGSRRKPYIARVTACIRAGKQEYTTIGYYENRQDALLALAQYHQSGAGMTPTATLEQVYQAWSESHYANIGQKTRLGYENAYRRLADLRQKPFRELKTIHFQQVINGEPQLSYGSAKLLKILLNQLYTYAMKNDLCEKNYARFLELPKAQPKKRQIFSDEEIQTLWQHQDSLDLDSILILIYTGFRISELLALTAPQVDLQAKTITGGMKTEAGRDRIVPIHPYIQPLIEKRCHLADGGKLFPISYRQYIDRFKAALGRLGIRNKTPHCTRHTFATLMTRGGADKKALQQIIGHSDYATTANIYTHLSDGDLQRAINAIQPPSRN